MGRMMQQINDRGLSLIKHFEGLRLNAYKDTGGVLTIGYGHTKGVQEGQTITQEQADSMLRQDVNRAETLVSMYVGVPLTGNEFSALVSLVFNVGSGPLQHTLGQYLKAGDYTSAANEFCRWNHVKGIVVDGLTDRREAERNLFLTKDFNNA